MPAQEPQPRWLSQSTPPCDTNSFPPVEVNTQSHARLHDSVTDRVAVSVLFCELHTPAFDITVDLRGGIAVADHIRFHALDIRTQLNPLSLHFNDR